MECQKYHIRSTVPYSKACPSCVYAVLLSEWCFLCDLCLHALQWWQVETYGSMEKKEKVEFILEQMRLCIAVKDYIRTQIISKKINTKFFQEEGTQVRLCCHCDQRTEWKMRNVVYAVSWEDLQARWTCQMSFRQIKKKLSFYLTRALRFAIMYDAYCLVCTPELASDLIIILLLRCIFIQIMLLKDEYHGHCLNHMWNCFDPWFVLKCPCWLLTFCWSTAQEVNLASPFVFLMFLRMSPVDTCTKVPSIDQCVTMGRCFLCCGDQLWQIMWPRHEWCSPSQQELSETFKTALFWRSVPFS